MSTGQKKSLPPATAAPVATRPAAWTLLYPVDIHIHAVLLLIAAALFSNGLRIGMAFDDHNAIVNNRDAHADKTTLRSIFFNDFWGTPLDRFQSNGSYRPLTVLTFRVQHWLLGYHHSPAFLHGANYVVACLNVALVFYLARLYVYIAVPRTVLAVDAAKAVSASAVLTSPLHAVPLMAALLYLVHPVHVDAVTSIVGRCELLYCLFGLVGFFCVHRYLNKVDKGGHGAPATAPAPTPVPARHSAAERRQPATARVRGTAVLSLPLSIVALILSLLCKDSAITFTALYGVHACVMYACGRCQRRHAAVVIVVAVAELFGYLTFRNKFVGNVDLRTNPLLRQSEHPQYFVPKGVFHWLSIRWLIQVKNLELLLFPTSLCNEYSFDCISHVHSMQDPRVPAFLAITVAAVATVLGLLLGTFTYRSRTALVGLLGFLWMAIPYAPVSHLFIAVGTFIAERCLYVPSIGAVLLLAFLVAAPGLRRGVVAPYFYALLLLCVGWGVMSHRRNADWQSNEHLSRAATRSCPNSGKAHFQLAAAIAAREDRMTPEVVALARRSLELDPTYKDGNYHLALDALQNGHDVPAAYDYLRKCLDDLFAYSPCQGLYERVRGMLFPRMSDSEQFADLADAVPRRSFKAVYLRQAGIFALQKENNPCLASSLMLRAMENWESTGLYWFSDEVGRTAAETTYCNALFWYEQSSLQCESAGNAGAAAVEGGSRPPPTPQAAARHAAAVEDRFSHCATDWHRLLAEPSYNFITIPLRISQYVSIGTSTAAFIHQQLGYTAADTPEQNSVLLSYIHNMISRYCHLDALQRDPYVRERVGELYPEQQQAVAHNAPELRRVLVADFHSALHKLRRATSLNVTQTDTLRSLLSMSPCARELASLPGPL
ncbi:hypothetical protein NESM_000589600 [Novymonas esmeraldas]|uniref:DUF1736 domain-containing protein n=1 Tax=Novymonas esmeraldas TaxID=1808958 RepID=A0AAW0ESY0_9TRYP